MHYIQKHILKVLTYAHTARFSEMRPPRIDSNLYSYHLRSLQKEGLVAKSDTAYCLSPKGLAHIDRVRIEDFEVRQQPKILILLYIYDDKRRVLLWPKQKQPFLGTYSLFSGKFHLEDDSVAQGASREILEKTSFAPLSTTHIGDCYIRVTHQREPIYTALAHVVHASLAQEAVIDERACWQPVEALRDMDLAPGTADIITEARQASAFFFKEFTYTTESLRA